MDCLRAQEIVSAAIRHPEESAAADFAEARAHCASCAECRAFLGAALSLDAARVPTAPAGLAERVIARVAQEEALTAARRTANQATNAEKPSAEEAALPFPLTTPRPAKRRRVNAWVAWGGGIAAVLIVTVLVARAGLSTMRSPLPEGVTASVPSDDSSSYLQRKAAVDQTVEDTAGLVGGTGMSYGGSQMSASFITHSGRVFVETSQIASVPASASSAGKVTTALDGTGVPQERALYTAEDGATVYVDDDSRILEFHAVTRNLGGKRYVMTSDKTIERFGVWPTLPSRFTPPATEQGSPTFHLGPKDDEGLQTYVVPGRDASQGFAMAPADGGDPNWSWWEPMP